MEETFVGVGSVHFLESHWVSHWLLDSKSICHPQPSYPVVKQLLASLLCAPRKLFTAQVMGLVAKEKHFYLAQSYQGTDLTFKI